MVDSLVKNNSNIFNSNKKGINIMSDVIQSVTEQLSAMFKATDEILNEWQGEGNLQFPNLMGMMAVKMNWNEKQVREADPIVRFYIRNNPEWYVTRGAHGGIMRATDRQKKEQVKAAKEALKQQMKATIEAKVAANASSPAPAPAPESESNLSDDE